MRLSIAQLLNLVGERGLTDVVASVMSTKLHDPEYTLTQGDVDMVGAKIEENYRSIPAIGTVNLFGEAQTSDTWLDATKTINNTADELRQLIQTLGLDTPVVWRE